MKVGEIRVHDMFPEYVAAMGPSIHHSTLQAQSTSTLPHIGYGASI
jgi:hypothetical protein